MSWRSTITQLTARGLTQAQIAALCNCSQVTVSDLYRGETKQPNFALGQSLIALTALSDAKLKAKLKTITSEASHG